MSKYQKKLIIIGDSGVYGWGDLEGGGRVCGGGRARERRDRKSVV